MPLPLCEPRVLSDAIHVLANPDAYANRPTLLHLAHQVARTAATRAADNIGGAA